METKPGTRVLLVDDEVDPLDLLGERLEQEGFEVVKALDGFSGLQAAREKCPDVIVSDIAMPGMDGREFLAAVRADSGLRHLPVILLTALASRDENRSAMQNGADDFIAKPFRVEEVAGAIRTQAARAAARACLADAFLVKGRAEILSDLPAELLTHLNNIVGPAELLALADEDVEAAYVREIGGLILQGAFNLHRLVGNFIFHNNLAHAVTTSLRAGTGRLYGACDYRPAIDGAIAATARARGRPEACFLVHGDLPDMAVAPEVLGKVVLELLDNAAAFSPPDSEIRIRCRQGGLTKIVVTNQRFVEAGGRRTGRHPAEASRPDSDRSRRGLGICRTLLKPFGGCVLLDEGGADTTATIILPLSQFPA